MTLKQYVDGYRYNSDTIFLYNFISKLDIRGSVLDVGSGCGILGLLTKRDFPNINLTQIEIQEKYANLSMQNAEINNIKSNIICGDFLNFNFRDKFDFIITNPPFYHKGSLKSKDNSLFLSRHSDALSFDKLAIKAYKILNPKGSFIFCYDAKQTDLLFKALLDAKFNINEVQFVHVNRGKDASLVMVYAKRESKCLCRFLPPLIIYEEKKYTKEIEKMYKKADTNSEDI